MKAPLPCYAAGDYWPDDEDAPVYVVRFHPPFLVARVEGRGLFSAQLFPWPPDTFKALPEAEQTRIAREMAAFHFEEIAEYPDDDGDNISFVIDQREVPPPFLTVDNTKEKFSAVVRLRPPVGWMQVIEHKKENEFKNWQTPEGEPLDAAAVQEMIRYQVEYFDREAAS
jgi:hypothetical protein